MPAGVDRAGMRTANPPIWPMRAGRIRGEITGMAGLEETLARIALRNDRFISSLPSSAEEGIKLDRRTCALARLAVLIQIGGATASFIASVEEARTAGASEEEIVDTLLVVLPSVGVVRASSAAPKIALALGYQLDSVLEENDDEWQSRQT
jgi:4-carboxymuconolactone decarboxylase